MKDLLEHLLAGNPLSRPEAASALTEIATGKLNAAQVASFLSVFRLRSLKVEELRGFRDAMLALCVPIDLSEFNPVDLCGTGGDGKNTFNISTLAAFVVAGAGYKVAKHGNYGVSSICGSSNLLERIGVTFRKDAEGLRRQLSAAGICFLHAPLFHPAMKSVAPIRRELGVRTFFNILGPMVNPAQPKCQIVGVPNLELHRLYSHIYEGSGVSYAVVSSLDGYDEVSLTGTFKLQTPAHERYLEPEDLGLARVSAPEIAGGDTPNEAARIFMQVIGGDGTRAQNSCVIANAALAIRCLQPSKELADCVEAAERSLRGGAAARALDLIKEA